MSISVSSQRMAAASLMQNGSTVEIEQIKTLKTNRLLKSEKRSDGLFDYYVSDFLRDYFAKKGVHTSVHSFQAHPHPCSKMIENHLLYNIVLTYATEKTLFVSCKASKIKHFLKIMKCNKKKGKGEVDLKNNLRYDRLVHAKDHYRYDNPHRELDMTHLPELRRLSRESETMVIHDEVQYWSLFDFQSVLGQMEKVNRILYTIIYPAEIQAGHQHSLFPEAYQFEMRGTYFIWMPDGQADGAYKQPVNPWLLSTSKTIDSQGRTWTISKLTTFGSHHVFSATLGSTITEDEYIYDDYTVIPPSVIMPGRRDYTHMHLRSRFIQAVLLYLMALKKPDASSAVAKMRQLTNGEENPAEALFVAQIAKQLQEAKLYDSMGSFSLQEAIWNSLCGALGDSVTYFMDKQKYKTMSMERFIMRCSSAKISIQREFRDFNAQRDKLCPAVGRSWTGIDDPDWEEAYLQNLKEQDTTGTSYNLHGEEIIDRRERRSDLVILCARLDLVNNTRVISDMNIEVLISPLDNFKALRLFIIRLGPIRGLTSRALPWQNDAIRRFEQGTIDAKRLEEIMFGKERERKTQQTTEPSTQGAPAESITTCACGAAVTTCKMSELPNIDALIEKWSDKLKGRRACFYSRHSAGYEYNGGKHVNAGWPEEINEIAKQLNLDESYDHCLAQVYEAGSSIGFHADDEDCYDNPSVVTVNLRGEATFRTKCTKELTFDLSAGDVLTMPKGFQETHKHSVTSKSQGRVSLTFRNGIKHTESDSDHLSEYEETEAPFDETLEILGKNVKSLCCLDRIAEHMGVSREVCASHIHAKMPRAVEEFKEGGMSISTLLQVLKQLDVAGYICSERGEIQIHGRFKEISLFASEDHIEPFPGEKGDCSFESAMDFNPDVSRVHFMVDQEKASHLSESFREGFTGVNLNKFRGGVPKTTPQKYSREVHTLMGFAGSGKSYYPQTLLKGGAYKSSLVITPRKALAADWESKIAKGAEIATFEVAFKKKKRFTNLIIDEIGLLPPGYIDLAILHFNPECVLLLGDPLQAEYHNKQDELFLAPITESIFSRLHGKVNYLFKTHRLPKNQDIIEVPSKGEQSPDYIGTAQKQRNADLVLHASRTAKDKGVQGSSTIGEAQGLSANVVRLEMDLDWGLISDQHFMVALTRARKSLQVSIKTDLRKHLINTARSSFLRTFLQGRKITKAMLLNALNEKGMEVDFIEREMRFADSDDMEDKLAGDPYLKGLLKLYQDVEIEEVEITEPHLGEPQKTHLPISAHENEISVSLLKAKEHREVLTSAGLTEQIDDEGYKGEVGDPMTHKALYLHHKNSDVATFFLSVKKRLRFRDQERNTRKFNKCRGFGAQMFKIFKETYKLQQPLQLPDLDRVEAEFVKKRLNKSKNLIEKHSYRSDPDWPSNYLKVFLKQQTCTKMEKRGVDAKAGQTIACFCHAVLCRFGVQLRRTEKALRSQLGPNVLIYSQLNYTDLDKWCKNFVPSMIGTDSDYEAFDRSQDEKILDFELEVLKFFLWPEELIEEYKCLKLMMGCSMGGLAVMRFSGEFGTFFFNTVCNMAFTCLRYNINESTPVCYAGDDMYAPGVLTLNKSYEHILDQLSLKAKVRVSTTPLFCGWRMSPYGIVKDPNLLLDRWKIAHRNGNLPNCMVNYAIEACYGYRLGEYLFDVNIDIDAQQELVRAIVKVKHLLPKAIGKLFSKDPTECFSDEEDAGLHVRCEGGLDTEAIQD
nr:MAG: RNA-dependent RNA polymerase [Actinidia virus A]